MFIISHSQSNTNRRPLSWRTNAPMSYSQGYCPSNTQSRHGYRVSRSKKSRKKRRLVSPNRGQERVHRSTTVWPTSSSFPVRECVLQVFVFLDKEGTQKIKKFLVFSKEWSRGVYILTGLNLVDEDDLVMDIHFAQCILYWPGFLVSTK